MSVIIEPIYFWKVYKFFQGNEEICHCGIETALDDAEMVARLHKHLMPKEYHYSDIQKVHYPNAIDVSYLKHLNDLDKSKLDEFKNNYYALSPKGNKELDAFLKVTRKHEKIEEASFNKLSIFYAHPVSNCKPRS